MTVRLSVQTAAWQGHVRATAAATRGLIPVVKGNGYGFGRAALMPIAAALAGDSAGDIAVGTVFEAVDVPADRRAIVLNPHLGPLPAGLPASAVLTVGNAAHALELARQDWRGVVTIKLLSSMRRYGVGPDDLDELLATVAAAGCAVDALALHLPLAGTEAEREIEVQSWVAVIDRRTALAATSLALSHLSIPTYDALSAAYPHRTFRLRSGTALWHGDKSFLHLSADVADTHPVRAGHRVGYHATPVPTDGTVVIVGAGSAHGVQPLDGGLSPFHFERRRLTLLEAPHMHSSLLFVPVGERVPHIGGRVDLQRPLISTTVDEIEWSGD